MIPFPYTMAGLGGSDFDPVTLFAGGEKGLLYDFTNTANLFQDSARTTPVTALSDPIGSVTDLSGNNLHGSQATTASKPTYSGYADFDGFDDGLSTATLDLTATDAVTVVVAMRKDSDAASGMLLETSVNLSANNGTIALQAPGTVGANLRWNSKGTSSAAAVYTNAAVAAPVSAVLTGLSDISSDTCLFRVNGVQVALSASDQGTGNFGNFVAYLGRRAGASLPFDGRVSRLLVIGRLLSADELANAEAWCTAALP
jgi:hypothetical protein